VFGGATCAKHCAGGVCCTCWHPPCAGCVEAHVFDWGVEAPIAALCASFPNLLHFELEYCPESMASSLSEAIAAWPMLQSISSSFVSEDLIELTVQQHLGAAARTAAGLKAGQSFEIVLGEYDYVGQRNATRMDVLVAAVHNAGGGTVDVRWEQSS